MKVYELHAGKGLGSRVSTCATVERAKQAAEERLKGYHESAKDDPEDWGLVESLVWELKPYRFGSHERMVEDKPRWTAQVSDQDTDVFTIKEIEVLE